MYMRWGASACRALASARAWAGARRAGGAAGDRQGCCRERVMYMS